MFRVLLPSILVKDNLFLSTPIELGQVLDTDMSFFDKDGFELNHLEQLYYQANRIEMDHHLYHIGCGSDWLGTECETTTNGCGIHLDHSMIMYRYQYVGAARRQLEYFAEMRPVLYKLLQIKPKWGLDVSIDWVDQDGVLELVHLEIDRYSRDELIREKNKVEALLASEFKNLKHVADTVRQIREYKFQWGDLPSDDQTDWKVRFMSTNKFLRAFDTRKSI